MKSGSIGTKNPSQSDLNLPNQQQLFTIDLTNSSWDDIQITENMKERQNEYKRCFELNIKNCNLVTLGLPFELIYLGKLNVTRTKLQKIENINYTANLSTLNLSYNQLKKIPDIYSLTKLEMLFLNDNFIEKVDFNHFKDLRSLRIINLQNNRILFRDVNEFTSNMLFLRDKLKQLKSFSFLSNSYYAGAPKERISDFLDFFQRSFLSNLNFESEKDKLEKEFNSKIEEIMDFQQRQSESLSAKVYHIKKQIEAFSLNPHSIETKFDIFKESTNNFLQIMNSSANQSKLISAKSAVDSESHKLEEHFCDIIRDLNILTDKVDNKAFIEQCMHFLVGILRIKQGFLAESIMELLTHIAEHKKMEEVLIKFLIKNLTGKEHLDYNLNLAKGDDEKTLLIEEINGQSTGTHFKRDKGTNDEEEISLASILKADPKILESFKMIVNEKYDRLFVYLFRILLKNIKYGKLMASLNLAYEVEVKGGLTDREGIGGSGALAPGATDANSFVFYEMEFFYKCFSGKAKRRILQSLHHLEIMKLVTISIGIFRKYEFSLKEASNHGGTGGGRRNDKKIQNQFLDIVATFAKIFKSILKYFFIPYINKKVFSEANEHEKNVFIKVLKAPSVSTKEIDNFDNKNNDVNSNITKDKIEDIKEFQKQKSISEYLQKNFRLVIADIICKDLNNNNRNRDLKFENLSEDNFYIQFENFIITDILENYKQNIIMYRKKDNSNSQANQLFILGNQITSYFLKINVLIKTVFMDPNSNSYLKSLNEFYSTLYRDFLKRLDDGDYSNIRVGATRLEKSRSNFNIRNSVMKQPEMDKEEYFNQGDSDDQNQSVYTVMNKNRGANNNLQSERDFFFYDPLMLNSINFILNLILHQNSLYSQFSEDMYLVDHQEKFVYILKRIDETSNDYKLIFRFANFYENKKEEVAETNIVALSSLSNPYLLKFINSSLNIMVFLGKLNELCSTKKIEPESEGKIMDGIMNNNNNNLEKSQIINLNNKNASFTNNKNNKSYLAGKQLSQIGIQAGEKVIDKITSKLNENNRDDIMLKCINIPNINIKRKIMEILLTVNYDQISEVEFDGLVNTLKNSNFLDLHMEDIVTKSFIFIIRLLNHKISNKEDRLFRIDDAIECGIKLALESNMRNYFSDGGKFKSAQNLNLILSVFLINLSTERKFDKIYSNKEVRENNNNNEKKQTSGTSNFQINQNLESIKKMIFCEYESVKKFSENNQELVCQMFPLFYEKIYGMWNVNNIRDFLVNYNIYPYNFIVFRLFRQLADVLMNVPYPIFNIFEDKDKLEKVIEDLREEFKQREVKAIEQEKKNWTFMKKNKANKHKTVEDAANNMNNFNKKANNLENKKIESNTRSSKILNVKLFENIFNNLNTKPQFISLSGETWKEQKLLFFDKFRDFLNFLCGEPHYINEVKTRLEDFKFDYQLKNPDQSASGDKGSEEHERLRANLYWGNNEVNMNENQRKGSNENEEKGLLGRFTNLFNKNASDAEKTTNLNNNNKNNLNSSRSQFKNSMNISNLEPVIKTYLQTIDKNSNTKNFNFNFYSHIKEDLREECDFYGTSSEKVFRVKEHETVDNCYLRSLIIAAFLRCIFAMTKNENKSSSNSHSSGTFGRFNLIEVLRNPYIFQKLIMLVDSTKMHDCNINTKILTIIKHVFEKISKNFVEKSAVNSDKKMNNAYGNYNKNAKPNEARNAVGSGASKHDFSRLVNISSIIIEKTLDNIYFNHRAFSQDASEESYTALVRKLVKCCLCIKKEIFIINLTSEEKKDLLKKILSTRLILVLINHALKIMDNDIPLQKLLQNQESNMGPTNNNNNNIFRNRNGHKDKLNNNHDEDWDEESIKDEKKYKNKESKSLPEDTVYNDYFVDLLILLAEFISCRQEIYIIIIEYVCKKYYIEKMPIRQSFIKDLADLRNYSFSSQLQREKGAQDNYDNILFISVCKIIFAYYEDKNKSQDFESNMNVKINQSLIKNEICIIILDQTNIFIKKFNPYKKTLDISDIKEAKTLAILRVKEEVKDIRTLPYGNRIFLKHKDNRFVLSLLFKKSIESHLFLTAIKNVEKKIEFRIIESELDKGEDSNSSGKNNFLGDDLDYGYGLCGDKCYNTQEQKDAVAINKKSKRSRSKNNKKDIDNEDLNIDKDDDKSKNAKSRVTKVKTIINPIKLENEEENENKNDLNDHEKPNFVKKKIGVNNQNSDIRSISSNRTKKKDDVTNSNDKANIVSKKKRNRNDNDNEENKSNNNPGELNNNLFVDNNKLTGEEKFKYLKELREKRAEEKNNKLNESVASYNSNSSKRSKSGKMISMKVLKNKLLDKKKEEMENNEENNKDNENNVDCNKHSFSDKIFVVAIDFSSFSNVDDLNEEALYRNLYILKLIGNDKMKIFKEKENNYVDTLIENGKKNLTDMEFFAQLGDAIYEVNIFGLDSFRNILFDNRKIIIEFKNSVNLIMNRPIQIYPIDDRGFFYLRNFFVRFIYLRGYQNYSRNFLTEAISTRIFKN